MEIDLNSLSNLVPKRKIIDWMASNGYIAIDRLRPLSGSKDSSRRMLAECYLGRRLDSDEKIPSIFFDYFLGGPAERFVEAVLFEGSALAYGSVRETDGPRPFLSYHVSRGFRELGIGKLLARRILLDFFSLKTHKSVFAEVDADNVPSIKLMLSLGAKIVGIEKNVDDGMEATDFVKRRMNPLNIVFEVTSHDMFAKSHMDMMSTFATGEETEFDIELGRLRRFDGEESPNSTEQRTD